MRQEAAAGASLGSHALVRTVLAPSAEPSAALYYRYQLDKGLTGYWHRNVSSSSARVFSVISGGVYFSAERVSVPDSAVGTSDLRPSAEDRDPAGTDRLRQHPGCQHSVHAGDCGYRLFGGRPEKRKDHRLQRDSRLRAGTEAVHVTHEGPDAGGAEHRVRYGERRAGIQALDPSEEQVCRGLEQCRQLPARQAAGEHAAAVL